MKTSPLFVAHKIRLHGLAAGMVLFIAVTCGASWGQAAPQAQITKATIFKQIDKGDTLGFLIQIEGTNLTTPENPRVLLLPSTGVTNPGTPNYSATRITMTFSAKNTYVPAEVTLSYTNGSVPSAIAGTGCAPDEDVSTTYIFEPEEQVAKKYGHGVAKDFDVVQISIVNKCALPIMVPLAGISLNGPPRITSLSLEHVTSIFSNDRTFSGPRAVFFNIVQGMATLGSAIEPFFASGFTQGVSILGGGFTQGAGTIWKDLSSEQLQNLTTQSFQATEQIAASGGSLQKSIFFARTKKKANPTLVKSLTATRGSGASLDEVIKLEIIPVLTAGGK